MSSPRFQSCPNCQHSCNTPNDDSTNVYSCGICSKYYCHECNNNREMDYCPHCYGRTRNFFIEGWIGMTGDERSDYYREQDEVKRIRQSQRQPKQIKSYSPPPVSLGFDSIQIVHNVKIKDGTIGMRVKSTIRVNSFVGEFQPSGWFYNDKGKALEDTNGKYCTSEKKVGVGFSKYNTKRGKSGTVIIGVFFPYCELHLKGSGVFKLFLKIGLFYPGTRNKIGSYSYRKNFKVTKKVSGGFFSSTKVLYHAQDIN